MNTIKRYDLAVAYRVYPGISKSPLVYTDDKYQLVELCLRSFKASLGTLNVKIWGLLDKCPSKYEELFNQLFDKRDLEIVNLNGVGNASTFAMQLKILCEQDVSELVYFAEDDYFYLPNQFEHLVEFIRRGQNVNFVSAYDHPGYYNLNVSSHKNFIAFFCNRHFRTASTACLTFLTTNSVLRQTETVFRTYMKRNYDNSIWLSLTKYKLSNPFAIVRYLVQDYSTFKIIAKAWLYCWKQILFGKRWTLWVPIPSIATHMEKSCLAPGIEWMDIVSPSMKNNTTHTPNIVP